MTTIRPELRILLQCVLTVGLLAGAAAWPTFLWRGAAGVEAMVVAAGAMLVASFFALIPARLAGRGGGLTPPVAALAAMVVRLLLSSAAVAVLLLATNLPPLPSAVSAVAFYLALLVVETAYVADLLKRYYKNREIDR